MLQFLYCAFSVPNSSNLLHIHLKTLFLCIKPKGRLTTGEIVAKKPQHKVISQNLFFSLQVSPSGRKKPPMLQQTSLRESCKEIFSPKRRKELVWPRSGYSSAEQRSCNIHCSKIRCSELTDIKPLKAGKIKNKN